MMKRLRPLRAPMSRACCVLTGVAMVALLQTQFQAFKPELTRADVERALKLAQAREDARARFHAPYITRVDDATLEQVEVVTEFRRYVQRTEHELSLGRWIFAQSPKDAEDALRPWRGRLSVVARLRFHPQNTLGAIPLYECTVGEPAVAPLEVIRTPIHARLSGARGDFSAPLLGATVETVFSAATIGQGKRPVILMLDGRELKRVTVDFSTIE